MANLLRGEVPFEAGDERYLLSFGINALCSLEGALGVPVNEIGRSLQADEIKVTTLRTVFWAGLQDHHEGVTEKEAGRLMDAIGIQEAGGLVMRAFAAAFPAPEAGSAGAGPRKGAKTKAGTGRTS